MNVKLLSKTAIPPKQVDEYAAGYDLFVPNDFIIKPGRNCIPLDIQIELLPGTEGMIRPRSGFSLKGMEGYMMGDTNMNEPKRFDADVIIGTIDSNYRGNVGVLIYSRETTPFRIKQYTRVAQMVISQHLSGPFIYKESLSTTDRGEEGFGHTGS